MTIRVIEVLVAGNGEVIVQTKGYVGAECLQASRWLEETLGTSVKDQKTAEFYTVAGAEQHLKQQ